MSRKPCILKLIAASVRSAARSGFLAHLEAEHAFVCERLGRVPGSDEHAGCMRDLTRRDACFVQDF